MPGASYEPIYNYGQQPQDGYNPPQLPAGYSDYYAPGMRVLLDESLGPPMPYPGYPYDYYRGGMGIVLSHFILGYPAQPVGYNPAYPPAYGGSDIHQYDATYAPTSTYGPTPYNPMYGGPHAANQAP